MVTLHDITWPSNSNRWSTAKNDTNESQPFNITSEAFMNVSKHEFAISNWSSVDAEDAGGDTLVHNRSANTTNDMGTEIVKINESISEEIVNSSSSTPAQNESVSTKNNATSRKDVNMTLNDTFEDMPVSNSSTLEENQSRATNANTSIHDIISKNSSTEDDRVVVSANASSPDSKVVPSSKGVQQQRTKEKTNTTHIWLPVSGLNTYCF